MNIKRILTASFAAAAVAFAAAAPLAQAQQDTAKQQQFGPRIGKDGKPVQAGQPGGAEVVGTYGAWKIECEPAPPAAEGATEAPKKQCGMTQTAMSEKNNKIGIKMILIRGKQNGKDVSRIRVMVPIGVYLPTGVAMEVDGGAPSQVPYTLCIPSSCVALADAKPETLAKMKKGSKANFFVYLGPGASVPISLSLDGFATAFGELGKLL